MMESSKTASFKKNTNYKKVFL